MDVLGLLNTMSLTRLTTYLKVTVVVCAICIFLIFHFGILEALWEVKTCWLLKFFHAVISLVLNAQSNNRAPPCPFIFPLISREKKKILLSNVLIPNLVTQYSTTVLKMFSWRIHALIIVLVELDVFYLAVKVC